ncbi:cyclin-like protein [Zopfochytrium polystomum]|nr:cyclin-like protein [Zopfochytrium polystomum]
MSFSSSWLPPPQAEWLFSEDDFCWTPSVQDGMTPGEEARMRFSGCRFITDVGSLLRVPAEGTSIARVYFQRFLMRHSFRESKVVHPYLLGGTALHLACKTTDNYRKIGDLVNYCRLIASVPNWKKGMPVPSYKDSDKEAASWNQNILFYEELMAGSLCFDFVVELPHVTVYEILDRFIDNSPPCLTGDESAAIAKMSPSIIRRLKLYSTQLLDDCMSTTLPLRYDARTVALIVLKAAVSATFSQIAECQAPSVVHRFAQTPLINQSRISIFQTNIFSPRNPPVLPEVELSRLALEIFSVGHRDRIQRIAEANYGKKARALFREQATKDSLGRKSPRGIELLHHARDASRTSLLTPSPMTQTSPDESLLDSANGARNDANLIYSSASHLNTAAATPVSTPNGRRISSPSQPLPNSVDGIQEASQQNNR